MRETPKPVFGKTVPPPRPTVAGALWLAAILSVPVFLALTLLELIWRVLSVA